MSYEDFRIAEREGWNVRAGAYDEATGKVTTAAIPTLLALAGAAPGLRILDLCCGTGRAAGAASALGARADGVDISPAMVEAAGQAFPSARFDVGDAEAIPRRDDTYDAVISSFGIMHVGSPETMFREIARVLKPGGRVALSHWVGPPESPFFKVVFGAIQRFADRSVAPPGPPPFALSSEDAMREALESAGFADVSAARLPLIYRAPAGRFAEHFRTFSVRSAVILDKQTDAALDEIYRAWNTEMENYLVDGEYRVPMPALALSATLPG